MNTFKVLEITFKTLKACIIYEYYLMERIITPYTVLLDAYTLPKLVYQF